MADPDDGLRSLTLAASSVEETLDLAARLGMCLEPGDVVLLTGPLGSGKTHFAKGVAKGLGIASEIVSPTFGLVVEYEDGRIPLAHMDLYRMDEPEELEDIDFHAIVDEGSPFASLVEWADLFPGEMPEDALSVSIADSGSGDGARTVDAEANGGRGAELLRKWCEELGSGRAPGYC